MASSFFASRDCYMTNKGSESEQKDKVKQGPSRRLAGKGSSCTYGVHVGNIRYGT